MNSLPNEVKLDVLKFLDFEQLFSVKQTNFYFLNLINDYEGGLARMKFNGLSIININILNLQEVYSYKFIDLKSGVFKFTLNDQLMKRWKTAIVNSIPLFLHDFESSKRFAVDIETKDNKNVYILKLPNFPKNIEEMIIIRCRLEQLSKCAFEYTYFCGIVFNPELINLLFDDNKAIPLQFHVQILYLFLRNNKFENILKFSFSHLTIAESLSIDFEDVDNANIDIFMNILINQGSKLPQVCFRCFKEPRLYDLIIKHITTSTDCSKMVSDIILDYLTFPNFKLSKQAKKVKNEKYENSKITKYQIANIYNPKVKFSFSNIKFDDESMFHVHIKRMKNKK